MKVRPIQLGDLDELASVFARAFNSANVEEHWTEASALETISHFYKLQPDLFFAAYDDDQVVGGVWGMVWPHWHGPGLCEIELFVDPNYHGQGAGKSLLKTIIEQSVEKYNAVDVVAIADSTVEFPMGWYDRIGLKRNRWVGIEGEAKDILKNLEQ